MSSRFDSQLPMTLEQQAHADAQFQFAEDLKRFTAYRDAVERLERNLSIMSLAAGIAAQIQPPKPPSFKRMMVRNGAGMLI